MTISAEQCVALVGEALRNKPQEFYSDSAMDWFADVVGIISSYDALKAVPLQLLLPRVTRGDSGITSPITATLHQNSCKEFIAMTRSIYTELRLLTNSFVTAQIGQGKVFDYFEEVRGLIVGATQDVLFIDPYIDADFVAKYLPQIPTGISVRLLTADRQSKGLSPAIKLYQIQQSVKLEVRVVPGKSLHDRHLVIDRRDVYQSGASFKDGARNAPTSINQIVDVAIQMIAAHEQSWASATVMP